LGFTPVERMIRPGELTGAAWLVSSVRGVVRIRVIDGRPLPESEHTRRIRDLLGFDSPA
jgi:4-amino-4-deoxychorismate lyase